MTRSIKAGLAFTGFLILSGLGFEAFHQRRQRLERNINDERTRKAVVAVMDSIRMEIRPIKTDVDSLKQWMRPFVFIAGAMLLRGAC